MYISFSKWQPVSCCYNIIYFFTIQAQTSPLGLLIVLLILFFRYIMPFRFGSTGAIACVSFQQHNYYIQNSHHFFWHSFALEPCLLICYYLFVTFIAAYFAVCLFWAAYNYYSVACDETFSTHLDKQGNSSGRNLLFPIAFRLIFKLSCWLIFEDLGKLSSTCKVIG